MTGVEWGVWIGYEIVVAVVVYAKSVFWFRREFRFADGGRASLVGRHVHPSVLPDRGMQTALQSWLALLMFAFFAAIGREGIKPEDIDAELGRAMMKVLKGVETPAPHRFDIDELRIVCPIDTVADSMTRMAALYTPNEFAFAISK